MILLQPACSQTIRGCRIEFSLTGKELQAKESCNAGELMGFFCEDYVPEDPRRFLEDDLPD